MRHPILVINAGSSSIKFSIYGTDATDPSAFLKGQIEIQDEGSQLAALLAGAKPGEQGTDRWC